MRVIIFLSLLVFGVAAFCYERVQFPGEVDRVLSPNKTLAVLNEDKDQPDNDGYYHHLFLLEVKSGKRDYLYSYRRHVDIIWSPDSSRVAVNDYAGSANADCLIFSTSKAREIYSVETEMSIKCKDYQKTIIGNHHYYITCQRWNSTGTSIEVKAEGYGEKVPEGFELWYRYILGGEFTKINDPSGKSVSDLH